MAYTEQDDALAIECVLRMEHFIWALGAACQLHRKPFDALLVRNQFPPPYTLTALQTAFDELGFRIGAVSISPDDFHKLALPCFILLDSPEPVEAVPLHLVEPDQKGEDQETRQASLEDDVKPELPHCKAALLLKADVDKVLYLLPGAQEPGEVTHAEFAERYIGAAIEFISKEAELKPQDGTEKKPAFGFSWFLPALLKHKRIWKDVLLASLAIQLVGLATPLFTQVVIDKVVVNQTKSTLIVIGVALVMFMLFTSCMTWLRQYLVLHTGNRIDAVLGSQVFHHLLRLPLPYFEHRSTGILVARLHGVETIREFISGAAVTLVLDLPFLFIFLAVMFWYSWQLSLIAVGLLGLICIMSLLVAPIFRDKLNQQFMLGARNQSYLTEYISGMSTVKSLQMEPHVEKQYGDYLASYLAAGFATKQIGNTYNVIANSVEQVMTLSILIVGALLVMRNDGFTVGMLVAFQMFAGRMSQPMLRLVGLWQEFQQANIAVKRLGDVLAMPTEPYTLTPSRERAKEGRVELVSIAFRYSEHHPWLYRNLDITFKPGHLTVLMGPSGCGKSTLAKLLQGFYQPSDGLIKLDGRDIRYLAANELRATFGVVPQETVLFSGTLYDNLLMAQPHATFDDIIHACKAAEIHDVIDQLPQGYQTEIGERGTGLSGGQRQRLAIARALLKRPKILIFDEAVSNLDQQTAEHFAKTINTLKGKVTMLFITHQVPKGLQVDEVIELGNKSDMTKLRTEDRNL